jgi:hypothetical protein
MRAELREHGTTAKQNFIDELNSVMPVSSVADDFGSWAASVRSSSSCSLLLRHVSIFL